MKKENNNNWPTLKTSVTEKNQEEIAKVINAAAEKQTDEFMNLLNSLYDCIKWFKGKSRIVKEATKTENQTEEFYSKAIETIDKLNISCNEIKGTPKHYQIEYELENGDPESGIYKYCEEINDLYDGLFVQVNDILKILPFQRQALETIKENAKYQKQNEPQGKTSQPSANIAMLAPAKLKPIKDIKPKITVKQCILAYILEQNAIGKPLPNENEKSTLEQIGAARLSNIEKSGNTFYKNYPNVKKLDLNILANLNEIGGENWREIILLLSMHPEILDNYLKERGL
jgi:hypothetical protein